MWFLDKFLGGEKTKATGGEEVNTPATIKEDAPKKVNQILTTDTPPTPTKIKYKHYLIEYIRIKFEKTFAILEGTFNGAKGTQKIPLQNIKEFYEFINSHTSSGEHYKLVFKLKEQVVSEYRKREPKDFKNFIKKLHSNSKGVKDVRIEFLYDLFFVKNFPICGLLATLSSEEFSAKIKETKKSVMDYWSIKDEMLKYFVTGGKSESSQNDKEYYPGIYLLSEYYKGIRVTEPKKRIIKKIA